VRSVIIEMLNDTFNTTIFTSLVPQSPVVYALAFVVASIVFINRSRDVGLSHKYAFWSGIWAIAFGLVGARFYWVMQNYNSVITSPTLAITGGTGSFGGYVGGILGFIISLRLYGSRPLKYMDSASSTIGLGICISRLGCFLNGCCFGTISTLPWAVRFPSGSLPYNAQLSEELIDSCAQSTLPIHPVQLYLAFNGLILFLITTQFWNKYRQYEGSTFFFFWLLFCVTRFSLEFLRGDSIRGYIGVLSTPQLLCFLLIPFLVLGISWSFRR